MNTASTAPNKAPVLKWISGLAYLLLTIEALILAVFVRPNFVVLFQELDGNLPLVSAVALSPYFYYAVVALGLAGIGGAVMLKRQRILTTMMVVGAALVIAFPGASFLALYLPVFELASAVEAE